MKIGFRRRTTIKDAIYQSRLVLKRESIGMEAEALDASIDENIPKNLKRAKAQRNLDHWDCTGPEWRALMRSRKERQTRENIPRSPKKNKFMG